MMQTVTLFNSYARASLTHQQATHDMTLLEQCRRKGGIACISSCQDRVVMVRRARMRHSCKRPALE